MPGGCRAQGIRYAGHPRRHTGKAGICRFVQRKKKQLIPTEKGTNLILVLPDNIKSPMLTAEWESMLKQVECGEIPEKDLWRELRI